MQSLKQLAISIIYLLLAAFMGLLSIDSVMNLYKQWQQPNFFNHSTNIIFMVFLLGTSLAGIIYLGLAFFRHVLSLLWIKRLHLLAFIGLLPALLWFLWMLLFHLGL